MEETFVAPRTPIEEVLAGIWVQVLGLKQVGVQDHFFESGGHSLLATKLASRIRETFQVELPLASIFEAPVLADLARAVENAQREAHGLSLPPPGPVLRDGELPLSYAQQRLWFLDQLEPGGAVYNIPAAMRLRGPLDVAALQASLNEVARRHEVLRTTFATVDGQPVQVIEAATEVRLRQIDLSAVVESEREAELQRLITQEAQRPFDLSQGPLLRVTLLRLAEDEHVLLVNMHHIISDGWSMEVLMRELAALYGAFQQGRPSPLPELPVQYADYAVWQRHWLQGEAVEAQLGYWRERLKDSPPVLELPTDRPRPAVQTFRGASQTIRLSREVTAGLKALSQRESVTVFMTLLAAWQTLLHRYSGQADILVGSPIAGRRHAAVEGLIGFFVNTLVLRTDLSGDPRFREVLTRVRQGCLEAYTHQDVPFEQVVEAVQSRRNLSHTPLFQVMFAWQTAPAQKLDLPGLGLEPVATQTEMAKFDLTLTMAETADGLSGTVEYNTDLFEDRTIARLLGHWETLLAGIVAGPTQPISRLPLLTEAEQQQLLVAWNETAAEYPQDVCVHTLFEAQAARTPDALAAVEGEQQLTYRELNRRANDLAYHLQELGVGPEVRVAICVERSLEMVVGILGILKAGGAYVPLDPSYPSERLAFMLADARAPVLLTHSSVVRGPWSVVKDQGQGTNTEQRATDHGPRTVVYLDQWSIRNPQSAIRNPNSGVRAENLAYVIYTSGSTGQPKGVELAHRGLVNLVRWHQRAYQVEPGDRATLLAGVGFDASVWEVWPYLTAGASLDIPDEETRASASQLVAWLAAEAITLSFLPTPLCEAVLEHRWPENVALRALLTGGDKLHRGPATDLPFVVANHYGPTEYTVVATWTPVATAEVNPPIGRPITNTQVYLLDAHLQPVPVGVPGELCISGDSLARGYLNGPEMTAEKFMPNPFVGLRIADCGLRNEESKIQNLKSKIG
jgi:amino acid adenylation domain-containing protein